VVGAGGLGCAALPYLTASGIGSIVVADADTIDLTNLQRQTLFASSEIGQLKAEAACKRLQAINPTIVCEAWPHRVDSKTPIDWLKSFDVIVDCSDNFATRYALNAVCWQLKTPLVSGSASGWQGQLTTFDFRQPNVACYHCLYPEQAFAEEESCSMMGVFSPLVGIIGSMQANETLKVLCNFPTLVGKLFLYDSYQHSSRLITFLQDDTCPVCQSSLFENQSKNP
jgi:molybdopterin-synthase adenylyltransferase